MAVKNVFLDEQLIQLVAERRFLYDTSMKEYRDNGLRENAWKTIGQAIGLAADEALKRWRSLRDKYNRERKVVKGNLRSGGADIGRPSKWVLYNDLAFLADHMRPRIGQLANYVGLSDETQPDRTDAESEISDYTTDLPVDTEQIGEINSPDAEVDEMDLAAIKQQQQQQRLSTNLSWTGSPACAKKRQRTEEMETEAVAVMRSLTRAIQDNKKKPVEGDDGIEGFCENVAARLRRFSTKERGLAFIEIERILFQLEFPD